MAKERVTLLIHADLARDLARLADDAIASENLTNAIETKLRKWLKVNRTKFPRHHSADRPADETETRRRATTRTAKRQKLREFGDALAQTRQSLGLSAEQMANKTGWEHSFVIAIEAGHRQLSIQRLHQLAHALGLSKAQNNKLENMLKELAPFVVPSYVQSASETTSQAEKQSNDSESQTNRSQSDPVDNQPQSGNCASMQHAGMWAENSADQADLTLISSAIFASAGVWNEEIVSPKILQNAHPHILSDSTAGSLDKQNSPSTKSLAADAKHMGNADTFFVALACAIKKRRHELGLRRRDVAERAQIESRQVARAETSKEISVENMFKIAEALALEPGVLAQRAQDLLPNDREDFQIG